MNCPERSAVSRAAAQVHGTAGDGAAPQRAEPGGSPWRRHTGAGPGCRAPGLGLERYGEEEVMLRSGREGGGVREDGRRARIMAAVADHDSVASASHLAERLCRFAVDEMALSG